MGEKVVPVAVIGVVADVLIGDIWMGAADANGSGLDVVSSLVVETGATAGLVNAGTGGGASSDEVLLRGVAGRGLLTRLAFFGFVSCKVGRGVMLRRRGSASADKGARSTGGRRPVTIEFAFVANGSGDGVVLRV